MTLYPCPYCGASASSDTGCPVCGRGPDPDAIEVIRLDSEIGMVTHRLTAERAAVALSENLLAGLVSSRRMAVARVHASQFAAPFATPAPSALLAAAAPAAPFAAAAPDFSAGVQSGREASTKVVQNTLFLLGGLLLAIAAIVFTAVAWAQFGVGGRAALLASFTAATLAAPPIALRRNLKATAETFAALGLLLIVLDGYAAWYVDLFGVDTGSPWRYAAAICALTAAAATGYGLLTDLGTQEKAGLRAPRIAAVLAVQPILALFAAPAHPSESGWAFITAAIAALNLVPIARYRLKNAGLAALVCAALAAGIGAVSALTAVFSANSPASASLAGIALVALAALPGIYSVRLEYPAALSVSAAAVAIALATAAGRTAYLVTEPGSGLFRISLALFVVSALAFLSIPAGPAKGFRIGALVSLAGPVIVAAGLAFLAAMGTLRAATPLLAAASGNRVTGADWSLPAALLLLMGALLATAPRYWSTAIIVGSGALLAVIMPAALDLPWWTAPLWDLPVAALILGFMLTSVAERLRPRVGLAAGRMPAPAQRVAVAVAASGTAASPSAPASAGSMLTLTEQAITYATQIAAVVLLGAHALAAGFGQSTTATGVLAAFTAIALLTATAATNRADTVTYAANIAAVRAAAAANTAIALANTAAIAPTMVAGQASAAVNPANVAGSAANAGYVKAAAETGYVEADAEAGYVEADADATANQTAAAASFAEAGAHHANALAENAEAARMRLLAGAAFLIGLLAPVAAAWTATAAFHVTAPWQARIVLLATLIPAAAAALATDSPLAAGRALDALTAGKALTAVRRACRGNTPSAMAAALITIAALPLWALAAGDSPAVYAALGLLLTITINPTFPVRVTQALLSTALLVATARDLHATLIVPFTQLTAVWSGHPIASDHVHPATIAAAWLVALILLARSRHRPHRPSVIPAAMIATVLTTAAFTTPWPLQPALELLLGLAALLTATLTKPETPSAAPAEPPVTPANPPQPAMYSGTPTGGAAMAGATGTAMPGWVPSAAGVASGGRVGSAGMGSAFGAYGQIWVGGWLVSVGFAGALATRGTTILALAAILIAGAVCGVSARATGARTGGWLSTVVAALGIAFTAGKAIGVNPAMLVLAAAAASLALAWWIRSREVEAAAHGGAAIALLLTLGDARLAAAVCTLWGLALGALAIQKRIYRTPAALAQLVAWWLLMSSENVTTLEVYTIPAAVVALLIGWLARREKAVPSWTAYGPGLAAAFGPSLIAVFYADDQYLRRLLLGVAALVTVLAGARFRLRAPVVLGGATLLLVGLHELARFWDLVPRWIPLALGGLLLVAVATTYERRRRDLQRLRATLSAMS